MIGINPNVLMTYIVMASFIPQLDWPTVPSYSNTNPYVTVKVLFICE